MNKKLLVILGFAIAISSCSKSDDDSSGIATPQITATAFISHYAANSVMSGYSLDSGIIAIPTAGASLSINYLSVPNGTPWKDTLGVATNKTDFPTSTYTRALSVSMLGTNLNVERYIAANTSSWAVLGDDYAAANITIPGTGSASFPKQAVKQNPTQTLINFPVNYGDNFQQTCVSSFGFDATITALSQTGKITVQQSANVTSNNIGWGTLKLKGYSDSMQVVVQKYTTAVTTNFSSDNAFISLALPSLLTSYGLTNGQTVTTTLYRYWAVGKGLVMTLNANGKATVTTGL